MKVYKIEVMVIDFDGAGEQEIRRNIENCKYISAQCMASKEADIGPWDDDHPLNKCGTMAKAYHDLFPLTGNHQERKV